MLIFILLYQVLYMPHDLRIGGAVRCPPLLIRRRNPIVVPSSCRTLLLGLDCIVLHLGRRLRAILFIGEYHTLLLDKGLW